ncbi:MAG: leucine-rich repeat protein [Oscillospiraceae bacterium]
MKNIKFLQRIMAIIVTAAISASQLSLAPIALENENKENTVAVQAEESSVEENSVEAAADPTVDNSVYEQESSVVDSMPATSTSDKKVTTSNIISQSAENTISAVDSTANISISDETTKSDAAVSKASINVSLKSVTMLAEADDVITGNCGQDSDGNLSDDLTYSYNKTTKELTISAKDGGTGLMKDNMSWDNSVKSAESLILEEGVKSIGSSAFLGFSSLKYVNPDKTGETVVNKFPEGLETIGASAFIVNSNNACTITGAVEFPSTLKSIGASAFYANDYYLYNKNAITSVKFAEGTKELTIGDNAFHDSPSLTSFEFPKSLDITDPNAETQPTLSLGANIFGDCPELKKINIPGSLKSLSANTIRNSSLTNITLGEGITEIAASAFPSTLTEIILPSTLKAIPDNCFLGCTNLQYVNPDKTGETVVNKFPEGLETIGASAFIINSNNACPITGVVEFPSTLKSIGASAFYANDYYGYNKNAITSVKFAEGTKELTIGDNAFHDSPSLTSFEFPKSLDITDPNAETQPTLSLGANIFGDCPELKKINIPGSLKSLSANTIRNSSLTNITLGEGITEIAASAFPSTLTEIILPSTLKAIPDNCFSGCTDLQYVNPDKTGETVVNKFPEGLETIGASAFAANSYNACPITGVVEFPSTLKSIGASAFYANNYYLYNKNAITSVKFAEGIKELTIGDNAFHDSPSLTSFEFPKELDSFSIGDNVFTDCSALEEINIPKYFGTINKGLFNSASSFKKIILEEGITAIEAGAFPSSLEEIILPGTIKDIPDSCFSNCTSLKYVNPDRTGETVVNKFPEGLETIGASAFRNGDNACPITGEVVFPSTLKLIGDHAFYAWSESYRTNKITSITFTEGTEELSIGNQAFQCSTLLEKFEFPNSLTSIPVLGSSIFNRCNNLTEINIPGCFQTFKSNSIFNGSAINKITLEEGITAIEAGACPSILEEIYLPTTLKAIPDSCFSNCTSLKYVNPDRTGETVVNKFPEGLETIGASAFRNGDNACPITGEVVFPSTLKSIGNHAFYAWSEGYKTNKITSITFTEGTEELSIGNQAFQCSTSLQELNLSDNIISIGDSAFNKSNQLSGSDLNLPKYLSNLGSNPFGSVNFKRIYTPLHPYHCYNSKLYGEEVHFRGIDANETATEGTAAGYHWGCFYNWCSLVGSPKLYIEPAVKHLINVKSLSDSNGGNMNFWDKFSEISFVGGNVINIDKSNGVVFPTKEQPLNNLSGMYYVTEQGILYAIDRVNHTAALAYVPDGIKVLDLPVALSVSDEAGSGFEQDYSGTYKVVSVLSHSIHLANDLTAIEAESPRNVTLGMRAFADCETLTMVNGVTTQKEANAIFGASGTAKMQKAFVNTGLEPDRDSDEGKPMKYLDYMDPDTGKLNVTIKDYNTLTYDEDKYRVLTGKYLDFNISAQAYGTSDKETQFYIYFSPSSTIKGFVEREINSAYNYNGNSVSFTVKITWDSISNCYVVSFKLPSGATWVANDLLQQIGYQGRTKGGELVVWGEVLPYTDENAEIDVPQIQQDVAYMQIEWSTLRNLYEYSDIYVDDFYGSINNTLETYVDSNHKPHIRPLRIRDYLKYRDNTQLNKNNDIGKDPVTSVYHTYEITLPEGLTWNLDKLKEHYDNSNIESLSEDGRTLKYHYTMYYNDQNNYDTGSGIGGYSKDLYFQEDDINVSKAYDYYTEHEITVTLGGTVKYEYSEPDEMQTITGKGTITALVQNIVYERDYQRNDTTLDGTTRERGRGLPVENYLKITNKGESAVAASDLYSITDQVINYNGYAYLTPEQMVKLFKENNEYLDIQNIDVTNVLLYESNTEMEQEGRHYDTQGNENGVSDTLINKYTEPKYTNVKLSFEVMAGETDKIIFKAVGSDGETIEGMEKTLDRTSETLAEDIAAELKEIGYAVNTGLYSITWNATDAAREYLIGGDNPWTWYIETYDSTVKTDFEQSHHYFSYDSWNSFGFFGNQPTALATFTLGQGDDAYTIERGTGDAPVSSYVDITAQFYNDETNQFESGMGALNEMHPGDILKYTDNFMNRNMVDTTNLPMMQTFDKTQCILAPVAMNPELSLRGFEIISFNGSDYYLLEHQSENMSLNNVWIGLEGSCFCAESIEITSDGDTTVKWYEDSVTKNSNIQHQFYTYVMDPVKQGLRPDSRTTLYANDYINDNPKYSSRIYDYISGNYKGESIDKRIVANPEQKGTKDEKTDDIQGSYIGVGESVTYRLVFTDYWARTYTLQEGAITDELPNTSGQFEWKLDDNVHVEYMLCKRNSEGNLLKDEFKPYEGDTSCKIEQKQAKIHGQGEEKDLWCMTWGEFKLPAGYSLVIYVTLDYPDDQTVWDNFTEVADTDIYNDFVWENTSKDENDSNRFYRSSVRHRIARASSVYLKTGMYSTISDPNGYIYANSDEEKRIVKYYIVVYNHGKSDYYLDDIYLKVPRGFHWEVPPKTDYSGHADWDAYGVNVTDENAPDRIRNIQVDQYVSASKGDGETVKIHPMPIAQKDERVGKYYLMPGQYISIEIRFTIDSYASTDDMVDLPVAMPVDDSHHVGKIKQVEGVEAHLSNDANYNQGTPEFWETDEIAKANGFDNYIVTQTGEEETLIPSETGKWVASDLKLTRKISQPGVSKNTPVAVLKNLEEGGVEKYSPQDGVSMNYPVQWESSVVNGGENAFTNYYMKDTVQWPYVFDRDVILESQSSSSNNKKFTITRVDQYEKDFAQDDYINITDTNRVINRDKVKVNNTLIDIAPDRATAFADPDKYSVTIFGDSSARVYFYKENDTFGLGKDNETFEVDLTGSRIYGVAPRSYSNGKPVNTYRTFSYWTRFDLSQKDKTPRTSYGNKAMLIPVQDYTKNDVSEGIPVDENGDTVKSETEKPAGIIAVAHVSVGTGQSTVAWMTAKEEGGEEQDVSDNLQDVLTKENKILLFDQTHTITYTMNVMNHTPAESDKDEVTEADDRKYSLKDMVIINALPHEGDKAPFYSRVPRNSDFEISELSSIKLYYEDKKADGDTSSDRDLHEIDEQYYRVLYSTKKSTDITDADWNLGGGENWKDTAVEGWYTMEELEEQGLTLADIKSVRIELHDPTTTFPSDETARQKYRELMKAGRTIVAQYTAKTNRTDIEPGKTAWNSFGYRFNRFSNADDENQIMEASSIRTGLQIPAIPILYQKLIDFNRDPYTNNTGADLKFDFKITKNAIEKDDGTIQPSQTITFSVNVPDGSTSNYLNLQEIGANDSISWTHDADDDSYFWEDQATYQVEQTENPEDFKFFSAAVNGSQTTEFTYYADYEPVIIYENQCLDWIGTMYKMDIRSAGLDPVNDKDDQDMILLPDAVFALFTTDETQKLDFDNLTDEQQEIYNANKEEIDKAAAPLVEFGGKGEEATQLYIKDIGITDDNGRIIWNELKDDKYYIREIAAPDGYYLNLNYLSITKSNPEINVYDRVGKKLPDAGDVGTGVFYTIGAILLLSGIVSIKKKWKRE